MTWQRCSSRPFAALRGQKGVSPRPFPDIQNYDLAKVFFVALRGPSRTKRCSPRPFPDLPNYDLAKVFFAALRGQKGVPPVPSRTYQTMTWQRCSSRPFAALRGQKGVSPRPFPDIPNYDLAKVFFAALRGPSRTKRCFPPSLPGQTIFSHRTPFPGLHQLPMRLEIGIGGPPVLSWLEPTIRTA